MKFEGSVAEYRIEKDIITGFGYESSIISTYGDQINTWHWTLFGARRWIKKTIKLLKKGIVVETKVIK